VNTTNRCHEEQIAYALTEAKPVMFSETCHPVAGEPPVGPFNVTVPIPAV
jgi:hypothetical protein